MEFSVLAGITEHKNAHHKFGGLVMVKRYSQKIFSVLLWK